jgi:hypothetical protein
MLRNFEFHIIDIGLWLVVSEEILISGWHRKFCSGSALKIGF